MNMETVTQCLNMDGTKMRAKHSIECQNAFRTVVRRSEERGMKVNEGKTGMICISGAQSYKANAFIYDAAGGRIDSGSKLKVLGFHFGQKASVHDHVEVLCRRMRGKYWVLYHLKKAGFTQSELAKVYRICLLPFLDYCAVVYHSLLTCLLYTSPSPRD